MMATEISAVTFLRGSEQGYTRVMTDMQSSFGTVVARFVLAAVFAAAMSSLDSALSASPPPS